MSDPTRFDSVVAERGARVDASGDESVSAATVAGHTAMARLADMLRCFEKWLAEWGEDPARWIAFDQFVRNRLGQLIGAERVRCFRVVCGGEALESLVPAQGKLHALVPTGQGILGHVLTHGCSYHRLDPQAGPAVHELAANSATSPCWCFPVVEGAERMGVVSIGRMRDEAASNLHLLNVLAGTISLMWKRLTDWEKLSVARQTDEGTGVLTRSNFFRTAETALTDGYASWEPAIVVAVVIEGVRGLDDTGLWEQRDSLLTAVGNAIRARVRSDDVVGRFADDRFVALLRRLDTALGQMIAQKLLEQVQSELRSCTTGPVPLRVRCGLAATGDKHPSLRRLISASFRAVERARSEGVDVVFGWDDGSAGAILAGSDDEG